jgi:hypothetical protein
MNNIKYQNYSHYKLPITMDPLKYGKLIEQIGNKYIITLSTPTNIAVIKHINNENFVRIFRKGELIFEYKEIKISEFKFIRIISDQKFTFENNKLIATEILNVSGSVIIFNNTTHLNYTDTNSIQLKQDFTPYGRFESIIQLFFIIVLIFEIFFSQDVFIQTLFVSGIRLYSMKGNIIKLRRVASKHK